MRPSEDMKTHQPSDRASRQASYGGSLRGKFQVGTSIPIPGHRMGMFRMHCRKKSHTHTHTQTHSDCTNLTYTTHVSHVPCIIQQSPAKKKPATIIYLPGLPGLPVWNTTPGRPEMVSACGILPAHWSLGPVSLHGHPRSTWLVSIMITSIIVSIIA